MIPPRTIHRFTHTTSRPEPACPLNLGARSGPHYSGQDSVFQVLAWERRIYGGFKMLLLQIR